jgi:hypothetical protein
MLHIQWVYPVPIPAAHPYTRFEMASIFPPIVAIVENLKLLAVQWMKGMGDREYSFL